MSYEITYHKVGLKFPKEATGHTEDLYAIVVQMGSNNCYEFGNGPGGCGRRARDWSALAFGTRDQVIKQVIYFASYCEGGTVKMRNGRGNTTMESFITSMRNTLKKAEGNDITLGGIQYKEGVISCVLRHRLLDPATGKEQEHNIGLNETDRVLALLRDPAYTAQLDSGNPAWPALKVWGPEIRADR